MSSSSLRSIKTYKYTTGQNIIRYDSDTLKFFYFGCWNRNDCQNDNPFNKVLNSIRDESSGGAVSNIKYDFGIISGDNIYSDKIKNSEGEKIKIFDIKKFKRGLECLDKLNIPVYSVLGNHDIEKCDIYEAQQKNYSLWWLQNYYSLVYVLNGFKVLFLLIDTNLFDDADDLQETCYENFDVETIKAEMILWIERQLETYKECQYIIIVGHEPLIGYKDKKGKLVTDYIKFKDIFNVLLKNNTKDIYYLSAHLHNFQYIRIKGQEISKYGINEIISGTGGAEPDLLNERLQTNIGNIYSPTSKHFYAQLIDKQDAYGYVSFVINRNGIHFRYKQVIKANGND
jgi:hypothetical protein